MRIALLAAALLYPSGVWAAEISTFHAYVDTDICARLWTGAITPSRMECSQSTGKDHAEPVLVRLTNNMVFSVNKQKMIEPLVGKVAEVSGEAKPKDGTIKLKTATPIEASAV